MIARAYTVVFQGVEPNWSRRNAHTRPEFQLSTYAEQQFDQLSDHDTDWLLNGGVS